MAFGNLLGKDKDIDEMTDDEIRAAVADYFTRWDLKPGTKGRVFPLRIPDAVLTGSLYSTHINTWLHYFTQGLNQIPLFLHAKNSRSNAVFGRDRVD